MNTKRQPSRILGAAFLLQAVTSLVSGAIFLAPLLVDGDMIATMENIAGHAGQMRLAILGDVVTAMGIIFLAVVLYVSLKKQNERMALIALGLYIFEAVLLAASRLFGYELLLISQESVLTGHPANLQALGNFALETMNYGYTLHMLPFCVGAGLFYFLMYKSGIIARGFSLWALITVVICLCATIVSLFGVGVPIFFYLPYAPFEFFIGIWILIKSVRDGAVADGSLIGK